MFMCFLLLLLQTVWSTPYAPSSEDSKLHGAYCGPFCLYLVGRQLGRDWSLANLIDEVNCSKENGCTMGDLEDVAKKRGLLPHLVEIPISEISTLSTPGIVYLPIRDGSIGHFVVCWGDGKSLHSLDPMVAYSTHPASTLTNRNRILLLLNSSYSEYLSNCITIFLLKHRLWAIFLAFVLGVAFWGSFFMLVRRFQLLWRKNLILAILGLFLTLSMGCGPNLSQSQKVTEVETSNPASPPRSLVAVNQGQFVAGLQPTDTTFTHRFSFRNTSSAPVAIDKVISSCPCLTVSPATPCHLQPGEEGSLEVNVHVEGPGPLTPQVFLLGEKGEYLLTLTVAFEGLRRWTPASPKLTFGAVKAGVSSALLLDLYLDAQTTAAEASKSFQVVTPCPGVDVEIVGPGKPLTNGTHVLLVRLRTNPALPSTHGNNAPLEMSLLDAKGDKHTLKIALNWIFLPSATSYPADLTLVVEKGLLVGTMEIQLKTGTGQTIARVETGSAPLVVEVEQSPERTGGFPYLARLRLKEGTHTPGVHEGKLLFFENASAKKPILSVPYRLRVIS